MRRLKSNSLPGFSLSRPVTVVMLALTLVGLGLISARRIPVEFLPAMDFPFIICQIPYVGATPEQVEKEVAIPAEGEFRTLSSVKRILTSCDSNGATIRLMFDMGTNMTNATADVRDRMERLKLVLPAEIDRIFLRRFNANSLPIMAFSIYSPGDDEELAYRIRTILQPRLMRIDGVADVSIFGKPEKEVLIEFDQDALRNRGVGLFQIVSALRQSSINVSAGEVTDGGTKYFVRTLGEFAAPDDIGDLIVGPNALRLHDIARVGYRTRDITSDFAIDGKSGTLLLVRKEAEANAVKTCKGVNAELAKLESDPQFEDAKCFMFFDQSSIIVTALDYLLESGWMGALLAVAVIYVFLWRIRPTLVVASAIPFSLVFALIYMYFEGMTLNIVTMISFVMALGMLVDDSIVVIENIYRHRQLGSDRWKSALQGAEEVVLPMTASCLTTIVVFIPLFYLQTGELSTYLRQFSLPMCISTIASLLVSVTVIPLAVGHLKTRREMKSIQFLHAHGLGRFVSIEETLGEQTAPTSRSWFRRITWYYLRVLGWSLRNRFLTLALIGLVLVLTYIIPMSGMQRQNMPQVDTRQVEINVKLDQGFDLDRAKKLFASLCGVVDLQRDELGIKNVFSRCDVAGGSINVYLYNTEDIDKAKDTPDRPAGMDSKYSTEEVMNILWQRLPKTFPGGELRFQVAEMNDQSSRAFALQLRGDDSAALRQYAEVLKQRMSQNIPDLTEITTDTERRRDEIQLSVRENLAEERGLTPLGIAQTVDFALRGLRLSYVKQGGREIPVWAQFQEEDRKSKSNLENVTLVGADGAKIALNQLVDFTRGQSPQSITRINGKNVVTITAKFRGQDMGGIMRQLQMLLKNFAMAPGYTVEFGDELAGMEENAANFSTMLIMAVVLIYVVLGATFESFILPLSILLTLPLSAIGAFWLIYLTNTPFDLLCMIGFILLAGIVVKNGIMLVDFVKNERERGTDRYTAILRSGRDRIRPVVMTALTTILGCVPLVLGSSFAQEVSFEGVGKIVIGGLITGTVLTLVIVPVGYSVIDDFGVWLSSYFATLGRLLRLGRSSA